jgi:predicted site-specific integrase-resolvase
MKRCALYARVSTTDKSQDPENQLAAEPDHVPGGA